MYNDEYEKKEENLSRQEIAEKMEDKDTEAKGAETSLTETVSSEMASSETASLETASSGTGEEEKRVNFTMAGTDAAERTGSSAYGAGQSSYGSAQNAGSQSSYGGAQNVGSQSGYGGAQNAGGQSGYGSVQNGTGRYGYGNAQNAGGQNSGYGNAPMPGGPNSQGSAQNAGSPSGYGNAQNMGSPSGYGSRPPYGAPQNGANSQQSGQIQHYAPWQRGGQGSAGGPNGAAGPNGAGGPGGYGGNAGHGGGNGGHNGGNNRPSGSPYGKGPKKSGSVLKRAAGITAAALLFGVVAGGTIAGIGFVTDGLRSQYAAANTESPSTTIAQAETEIPTVASGNEDSGTVTYVATNDVSSIVEKAMPSVVAINSVTEYQTQNWFGQPQTYEGRGSGSGIIIGESDTELLIVTNNHVIEGANTLSVTFNDGEAAEANVKGTDSENDLAVIAVALDQIPEETKSQIAVATIGDSDSLKVGQGVIAIGNALGYGQSVTVGYVSALDREVTTEDGTTRNLLQTDAAINPGNSGGALLNMQGEVVGINSAKYSSTEVEGMGYAIPITKVQDIIDELMTKKTRVQVEETKQGYLGIQGTDIDSNTAALYGMPQGIYVYKIMEDVAAAASTLQEKDSITKFDGQTVRSMTELKDMLTYYAGGDSVDLTVQRLEGGQYKEYTVTITLGTKPAEESTNR